MTLRNQTPDRMTSSGFSLGFHAGLPDAARHRPFGLPSLPLTMKKTRKIKQQICTLEQRLAAAEEYVARNVNVRGFPSWLKLSDWKGKSGHPLWMRNHMIPSTQRARAEKERALQRINAKGKEKQIKQQRRPKNEM